MRAVLHIGQQKTGTSAIQAALASSGEELIKRGVLYPRAASETRPSFNHFPLAAILPLRKVPRGLRQFVDGGKDNNRKVLITKFDEYCRELDAAARQTKPDVVVLSTELLYRPMLEDVGNLIKTRLSELFGQLTVVAYVRKPSDLYLAYVQQLLRSRPIFKPPGPVEYRDVLQPYRTVFGDDLKVVRYGGGNGWNVIRDFTSRFLPELDGFEFPEQERVNASSSAEIMAAMQDRGIRDYRDRSTNSGHRLEARLNAISQELGCGLAKARLRPEVASYIDQCSADLLWLKDEFAVEFEGIDYQHIGEPPASTRFPPSVQAICEVNQDAFVRIAVAYAGTHSEDISAASEEEEIGHVAHATGKPKQKTHRRNKGAAEDSGRGEESPR